MQTAKRQDWETPQALFDELNKEFAFTIDAAATPDNAKLPRFWTPEKDALAQEWGGERVWLNPPYGRELAQWTRKAAESVQKPGTIVVMLIPARTDTRWFHEYIYHRAEIRFLRGRLKYELGGEPQQSATFPSMLAIFRSKEQ